MKQRLASPDLLLLLLLLYPTALCVRHRDCAFAVESCVGPDFGGGCDGDDFASSAQLGGEDARLTTERLRQVQLFQDNRLCEWDKDKGPRRCCAVKDFKQGDINLKPTEEVCGIRRATTSLRVAAGIEGDPRGFWPWMASYGTFEISDDEASSGFFDGDGRLIRERQLRTEPLGRWRHRCGATIVSRKFAITAAHCIKKGRDRGFLRVGDVNLSSDGDDHDASVYPVSAAHVHPSYRRPRFYFDVAVLEVFGHGVVLSDYVVPVCLPEPNADPDSGKGRLVTLTGWGQERKNVPLSDFPLRRALLSVYSQSYCNSTHTIMGGVDRIRTAIRNHMPNLFSNSIICAGYESGGVGSCSGDSGGPLVRFASERRRHVQVGVVSGGVGRCGDSDYPGVYVRMEDPAVLGFVHRVMQGNAKSSPKESPPNSSIDYGLAAALARARESQRQAAAFHASLQEGAEGFGLDAKEVKPRF